MLETGEWHYERAAEVLRRMGFVERIFGEEREWLLTDEETGSFFSVVFTQFQQTTDDGRGMWDIRPWAAISRIPGVDLAAPPADAFDRFGAAVSEAEA